VAASKVNLAIHTVAASLRLANFALKVSASRKLTAAEKSARLHNATMPNPLKSGNLVDDMEIRKSGQMLRFR
jgi:hypothetical protein